MGLQRILSSESTSNTHKDISVNFYMLRYDVDDMHMRYWTLLGTLTDLASNDDAV